MAAAAAEAHQLEDDLMSAAPAPTLAHRLETLSHSCTDCHAAYRDSLEE
jgi:hypothetical protein